MEEQCSKATAKANNQEKIQCDCGATIYKRNLEKHLLSANHMKKLIQI
jgi:hypothetical protein